MILDTAADGNQGKLLIRLLLAAGAQVRACVRSEQSAEVLRVAGVIQTHLSILESSR
jgi:uncharacterized protein YbjT (DUF2867 family)